MAVDQGDRTPFYAVRVVAAEKHSTEDVGIIQFAPFPDGPRSSYFYVNGQKEFQGIDYHMWSYPSAVAEEIRLHGIPNNHIQFRPDMTFFKGYVRRRMPFSPNPSFSMYHGAIFFEVSEVGGSCSSGSPLVAVRRNRWETFAVYVGEETANRRCGYAVSLELVADWSPQILGSSIREEATRTASLS